MMFYLTSLLCCLLTISGFAGEKEPQEELVLSTPDQLATLTSEPNYLIGGLISPISGHPSLRQTDLIAKGAQNIVLARVYIPPYMPEAFPRHKQNQQEYDKKYLYTHLVNHYRGWQFFPHLRLEFKRKTMEVRLSEPNGATFDFRISGSKTVLASPPYAISNVAGDEPRGIYDPRNIRISYEDNGNKIIVYATDGATRFYNQAGLTIKKSLLYHLQKEILPNGKVIKYHYNEKRQLTRVESMDPLERHVYASLNISGSPIKGFYHFTSSSGMTVDYGYQTRPLHYKIKEKIDGSTYTEESNAVYPSILSSVSSPYYRHETLGYNERFLLNAYSGKNHIFNSHHSSFGNEPHYRVDKLSIPVGQNDSLQSVYELNYYPIVEGKKEGSTIVKNSDGTATVYHFSKDFLLTSIQYYGADGSLKKEKKLFWNENNWLKSVEMQDGHKNLFYKKSYEFDGFGNPVLEVFTGDLTGSGTQESYTIRKEFSQDGRNLLVREEFENGKVICLSYLPNTNLVIAKLTKNGNVVLLREFSKYDDCHNLIQTISDDGIGTSSNDLSGLTQRTIVNYLLRQQTPFLHMPEWIEEKYLEEGQEKLLKRKHLTYDQHGNVAQEDIYDANNQLAYTIYREYNERRDLISETNSLGQKAAYSYDHRGNLNAETNFSGRLQKTIHYDGQRRLRKKKVTGDDGAIHESIFEYDFHDRLIKKTDHLQNSTYYTYDTLISKIAKTVFPSVASINNQSLPVTTFATYDPFGRELLHTDANGNTTAYRYNVYGSISEITYPDGGKEHFFYEKNGTLACHIDQDGLTIRYTHDIFGRTLSKKTISAKGESLAEETFTYSGFNLLAETDKEGNVTKYSYDGAGRKVKEQQSSRINEFSYDCLGRLVSICKHNGDNTLFIAYKKDLEGRLLEESKSDAFGNLLYKRSYTYDEDGNKATIIRSINGKEAIDIFKYDAFGRLVEHRDPNSFITKQSYNENYINKLGQRVLQTAKIDPSNTTTLETTDSFDRVVKKEVRDPQGMTLSCREKIYDPHGNLTYRIDSVYNNDLFKNTQIIHYTYTNTHQIESLTKAFGTKDASRTSYAYSRSGKLETKIIPDGVMLSYDYHPLGFLSRLSSSDGTIFHTFEYDKLGNLKSAIDKRQNISIERMIDSFGNVTQEVFPNGIEINKEYDNFNRITSLDIKGCGKIFYHYDPLFLREVVRSSNSGEVLYTHRYVDYDLDGNLVSEELIGNLGQVQHTIDQRGQKTSIVCSYFSQNCTYDAMGNLVENELNKNNYRYTYDHLSQLSSERGPDQSSIYIYDSLYNRIKKDDVSSEINNLNQLLSFGKSSYEYDLNGNQTIKQTSSIEFQLTYDPLNQLVEAISEDTKMTFLYDPLGRRLNKTVYTSTSSGWEKTEDENYLYYSQHEIGACDSKNQPKNLRILGIGTEKHSPSTIGIEVDGQVFAPILDVQGNVRRLIDVNSGTIANSYEFSAFGEELQEASDKISFNPWRFASKRFDPELSLIYFGKRYYDPEFARWLTADPAGFVDSSNLYQYVFNNPFRYRDPDGQFVFAIPLLIWGAEFALPSLSAIIMPIIYTAITGTVVYGGYKLGEVINEKTMHKNTDVYAPDRPLPRDEDGVPIPDTDAPHTQLGTKKGSKGKYPQAREFDKDGKPVKDIDFTDHGRPDKHPNPHQHQHIGNETGGTPERSKKPEYVQGWRY